MKKIGRNDPCPCGSGKKYKKCCGIENKQRQFSVLSSSRISVPSLSKGEEGKSLLGRVGRLTESLSKPPVPTQENPTPPVDS
jgi:hypothetical protein